MTDERPKRTARAPAEEGKASDESVATKAPRRKTARRRKPPAAASAADAPAAGSRAASQAGENAQEGAPAKEGARRKKTARRRAPRKAAEKPEAADASGGAGEGAAKPAAREPGEAQERPAGEGQRRRSSRRRRPRRRGGRRPAAAAEASEEGAAPERRQPARNHRNRRQRQPVEPVEPDFDDEPPLPQLPPEPPENATPVEKAAWRIGIAQLHAEQAEAIGYSQEGHDVLMVLPTGFGKSACYQIPSMVLDKPTVVLSPLLALLRDQHEKLKARDVPCVRIDGTVRGKARREAFERIEAGGPLLVMTTPESLGNAEASAALQKSGVALLAVDEAHCISEWGHDFRPAYRRIGGRIKELGSPPILALTATATPHVRDTIVESLGMREPKVIATSPHRDNLAFEVLPCEGDFRPRSLVRLAQRLRRPGIIYCATTREVDAVYGLLVRFKIPTHRYHGSMTSSERNAEQAKYMQSGRRAVMVATSAFGLGIDKPDIRYVLHYQAPASLEQYVQEAGRAGRDDRKANCILLHDPEDRSIHEALLSRSRVRPDQLFRIGHALGEWGKEGKAPSVNALALSAELGPRIASALLAKIEEAGLVTTGDDGIEVTGDPHGIEAEVRDLAGQFETLRTQDGRRLDTMAAYAHVSDCRAAFLRSYFGEDVGTPCGLCDVCRGSRERPESFFKPLVAKKKKKVAAKKKRRGRGGRARKKKVTADAAPKENTGSGPRRRRGGRGRRRRPKSSGDGAPTSPGTPE